ARPPSVGYRISKFIQKNRGLVAALGAIATLLVVAVGVSSYYAIQANIARNDALEQKNEAVSQRNLADAQRLEVQNQKAKADIALKKAEHEAKTTREMLNIFTAAFDSVDPDSGATSEMSAKDVLVYVFQQLEDSDLDDTAKARMLWSLGSSFSGIGEINYAISAKEKTLSLEMKNHGAEHPDTLRSMTNLAISYNVAGRLPEALELQEKTLALKTTIFGAEHPDTLTAMTNLANIYSKAGRLPKALELREKILALKITALGAEHPDTLTAMANLANSYSRDGRLPEALELREKTLALEIKILGPKHPDTLRAMTNLAHSYYKADRLLEALELRKKTLALKIKILGPKHPDTLRAMTNLAASYYHAGRLPEALELHEKTLALVTTIFGAEHPVTLTAMTNLALSYRHAGRLPEALELQEKVLELEIKILGPEHPSSLRSMTNLAVSYDSAGRSPEALELQEKTLALKLTILGAKHADTLSAMGNLAVSYCKAGRLPEALELQEKTLALEIEILGPEHPSSLKTMGNLANIYAATGRLKEARDLGEKTLSLCKKVFDTEHPSTLKAMNSLAATLSNNKIQLSSALQLFSTAYSMSLKNAPAQSKNLFRSLGITLRNSREKSLQLLSLGKHQDAGVLLEAMLKYHGPHNDKIEQVSELLVFAKIGQKEWQGALDAIALIQIDSINDEQEDVRKLSPEDIAGLEASRAVCQLELDQLEIAKTTAEKVLKLKSSSAIDQSRAKIVIAVFTAESGDSDKATTDAVKAFNELEVAMKSSPTHLQWYLPWMAKRISKVFKIAKQDDEAVHWATKAATFEAKLIKLAAPKINKNQAHQINKNQAHQINKNTWESVKSPEAFAKNPLTKNQLAQYLDLIQQHPQDGYYNTLATAEYRMGNFKNAIAASLKAIKLLSKEASPFPRDFAILAMSHFKLGEMDKADEYREKLDEAIKLDIFKDDQECKSFLKEVEDLFDSKSKVERDTVPEKSKTEDLKNK
ncbi:tetratricopeptide repeat protein, partial [Mariniblastus sp.]|nr:tetratricopeptide repeat protein [Mariniblastus sp.]